MASMEEEIFGEEESGIEEELRTMSTEDIQRRTRLLDTEVRVLRDESSRLVHEKASFGERLKENVEKIKLNNQLPYLVGNVVEVLTMDPDKEDDDEDAQAAGAGGTGGSRGASGASPSSSAPSNGAATAAAAAAASARTTDKRCVVLKTSTRQTVFLPVAGLVDPKALKPGDLVGVNKDSYLILSTLPPEYDARVKAMEVDEKPTEDYTDIGGLDKQIQELREAIVLPITHKDRFEAIGIKPPKGVLLYGPPGTGKTLIARACAAQTNATFLKLAGPALVQMFIGDGAKMVRDAFALAKEKAPSIVFIDEVDAVGTTRRDSELSGDREVQRTMLELLNQLDGFASSDGVRVIAATNRPDTLDPALLRSGRLDRKIEFPHPNEASRVKILKIHSRKMNVADDVNFEEIARSTDDFNAAQLKAVCVEAGMIALRREATVIKHEDFNEAVAEVQAKKKTSLQYYA